jgi:hypothetical protein
MLILVDDANVGTIARAATIWERLQARVLGTSLDGRLAAGAAPETSAALEVRALNLVRATHRAMLANSIEKIIEAAIRPARSRGSRVVPPRWSVLLATDILAALVDRLRATGPVPACGVAAVRIMLHDGAGPLYYPTDAGALRRAAQSALRLLDS